MNNAAAVTALQALAHPKRLAAFRRLVQVGADGMAVGALRSRLGVPAATLTAHLNQLRQAGLVADRRDGRRILVRADYLRMEALLAYLTDNCCAGDGTCTPARPCAPAAGAGRRRAGRKPAGGQ